MKIGEEHSFVSNDINDVSMPFKLDQIRWCIIQTFNLCVHIDNNYLDERNIYHT